MRAEDRFGEQVQVSSALGRSLNFVLRARHRYWQRPMIKAQLSTIPIPVLADGGGSNSRGGDRQAGLAFT